MAVMVRTLRVSSRKRLIMFVGRRAIPNHETRNYVWTVRAGTADA